MSLFKGGKGDGMMADIRKKIKHVQEESRNHSQLGIYIVLVVYFFVGLFMFVVIIIMMSSPYTMWPNDLNKRFMALEQGKKITINYDSSKDPWKSVEKLKTT